MMRNQTTNFWNSASQFFLGSLALSLVTLTCFRLGVDLASTAFAYLVVILLCSLMGSFTASALLATMSVAGLTYLFIPPLFSFRIDDPQHLMMVVAFFLTSLIVTRLIRNARKRTEAALQAEANLRRSEADLRESEQRFRDYAETASDFFWESAPDHRITRISESVNRAGIVSPGLAGQARWDYATDVETEPDKWRRHRAMLEAHLPFRDFVYRAASGTGSALYVQTSGKPFFDANGNFLGYRGVGTDITATIRADHAEEALRKSQAELAHITRVTMLGELTASISHEVNQPLAAVVNAAAACRRWLDGATPNLDEARCAVDWIINDGNRASEVIRRVRALAKKTEIEKVPLDINDAIRQVMALVQHELTSHRVSLRTELAPALPMILGDRVQLQQVFINLVMNGIEAMQPVTDRPRELMIRSGQDETRRVLVSVMDRGVGISAENADQLFNAFFTTKSGGLGMGLSICRSIVEAHGGRLSASANEGPGATFQFVLPLQQEEASSPSAQKQ